ncbi:hypothetical protein, partial [Pseudomonas syringae group genomosp. 7]|uniref:hypothetical protein n=1 Tax=Pseudomonas syringae group genomosp. 7 TaxID=251699 RepID=UPI00376F7B9D
MVGGSLWVLWGGVWFVWLVWFCVCWGFSVGVGVGVLVGGGGGVGVVGLVGLVGVFWWFRRLDGWPGGFAVGAAVGGLLG